MQLVVPCTSSFPWARFVRAIAALISFQYVSSLLGPLLLAALHVCEREEKGSNQLQCALETASQQSTNGKGNLFCSPATFIRAVVQSVCKEKHTFTSSVTCLWDFFKKIYCIFSSLACVCERQRCVQLPTEARRGQQISTPSWSYRQIVSPAVGAGNQMQVLWKSKDYSWTLSHPSSS